MSTLSYEFAQQHGVFVADNSNHHSLLICRQPLNTDAIIELQRYYPQPFDIQLHDSEIFQEKLQGFFQNKNDNLHQELLLQESDWVLDENELLASDNDAPIVRLFNQMLSQAIQRNASDIHIEPYRGKLCIRFRIDGALHDLHHLDAAVGPRLCSRIKVLANLDIAEQRRPQDGRISVNIAGRPIDLRVSTMPANFGERLVLRILDKSQQQLKLDQLGMPRRLLESFTQAINHANGIVLVTGPTGAGKTTTLYAALQAIHSSEKNILTVEDPIEYELPGIGQVPVNSAIDMGFAKALRAILRQDPDILMIGEIRDSETATIAVQASLTGHLVLSTLHTNNAVDAIARLLDLGQEAFLLSSSLRAILAQRLLRKLCPNCKELSILSADEAKDLGHPNLEGKEHYIPKGCAQCDHSGYRGRTGIYELIRVDKTLQAVIHQLHSNAKGFSETEQQALAKTVQEHSLNSHAIDRLLAGETSLSEMHRIDHYD